ncbi:MAG: TonB-dependent receptor domain-containing protein [Phycisphaerae bacterium]
MVALTRRLWLAGAALCLLAGVGWAQETGSIRGTVRDKDFEAPLPRARVRVHKTDISATASETGTFLLSNVPAGRYTLIVSKAGYTRQVKSDVVVRPGQMTELSAELAGDFAELEEFVVEDVVVKGTEADMLKLRIESAATMDSVSKEFISASGAGDALEAAKLVAGTTVQDGKYAVIRGLPDRYVNSQMNGVRLPTADAEKRAVQLDQFPSDVIESVQVSKTFTPDQQGDASGGAVNVVLKGIPEESILGFSIGYSVNTQVLENRDRFLTDKGGGVNVWGLNKGREVQTQRIGESWTGAAGGTPVTAPHEYSWSLSAGGRHAFANGLILGAFGNFHYDRGASYSGDGFDDRYWVEDQDTKEIVPKVTGSEGERRSSLYDIRRASESVQWGGLGVLGLEFEDQALTLAYMRTQNTANEVTIAEDTRGKELEYPGYDPTDPMHPGNQEGDDLPYLRTESIVYTERVTETFQLSGSHTLPTPEIGIGFPHLGVDEFLTFLSPEIRWVYAKSQASTDEPDKRLFGERWIGPRDVMGFFVIPSTHMQYKPSANINMGNLQRIWKDISETSDQYSLGLKIPFRQWTGHEGYMKFGVFRDEVHREYNQESYTNAADTGVDSDWEAPWNQRWSQVFPQQVHPIQSVELDVDYIGEQEISAWYHMIDIPLCRSVKVLGGARYESTSLVMVNDAEENVTWFPPEGGIKTLEPGEADVAFEQDDVLPSIGVVITPFDQITIRASRSETVARQTFKELSPILQAEYLGADVFVGNPNLKMSSLTNTDLRFDYRPSQTSQSLISVSWFKKDVVDPIEYIQRYQSVLYTTPLNYPEGSLTGWEFEVRKDLGEIHEALTGLVLGGNATFIQSEVTLAKEEQERLAADNVKAPMVSRDMMNAPEHLYNLYMTYDAKELGTKVGLFYTVRGDTLVAGAGQSSGNFIPNVYETEYGTLNFTLSQKLNDHWTLKFKAKNLLNPKIQTVYRSEYIGDDVVRSSYRKGIDFSVSLGAEW